MCYEYGKAHFPCGSLSTLALMTFRACLGASTWPCCPACVW